jgi:hypothetical protein
MANIGLRVRDENEQQIVDIMTRCHDWLANELDIESNMAFGRTAYWGDNAFHAGLWYDKTKQSVLNFRNLYGANVYQLLKIIAHEARHGVQYKTGMLTDEKRSRKTRHDGKWETGVWNGEYWSGRYRDAPWEVDARAHEKIYAQLVIDAGIITQEELSLKLAVREGDSDHMIVRLDTETHQAIQDKHGEVHLWKAAVQTREEYDANKKLFQSLVSKAFILKGNVWNNNKNCKLSYNERKKVWKDALKQTKLTYRNDAFAFLTQQEMVKLKKAKATKNDMFWAAQKNVVEYKTRPATEDDLVY